jgi:hypothetical protein
MPNFLALSSLTFWLILMFWFYQNSPAWFFMPFFVVTTLFYLKMMEVKSE